MADNPLKSGPLAIPLMLLGLLAAGALVPHLSSSPASSPPQAASFQTPAPAAPSAPDFSFEEKHVTNVLDLLAEYFGVDVTSREWSADPGATIRRASVRQETALEFLVATVPDPIDSYETWQFDPQIDAIRQGIEASGYLLDRFFLPDTGIDPKATARASGRREVHKHWPGVVLFRSSESHHASLLVLFLVPETPVSGIHQEPFRRALRFIDDWMNRDVGSAENGIRILGPTFSGSTGSIVRALAGFDSDPSRRATRKVSIISGSATNGSNLHLFEESHLTRTPIRFHATMHSNAAVAAGLYRFLCEAGLDSVPTAYLSESSTAYGDQRERLAERHHFPKDDGGGTESTPGESASGARASCRHDDSKDVIVKYPFNIAQLRLDAGRDNAKAHDDHPGATIPGYRPLSFEDATVHTDQFPLMNSATTSSSVELVFSTLLEAVRREHVRIVNIDSTDVRDKLFLIKEVKERDPDVLITSTDGDLFEVHPDQAPWLTGLLVASTYPLHISSQDFVYPFHGSPVGRPNANLMQFSSANMAGHYNAAIALLNYDIDGRPLPRYAPDDRGDYPTVPKLIDYGGIDGRKEDVCNSTFGEPGVWISIVGDGQIIPLRVYCGLEEGKTSDEEAGTVDKYVFRPKLLPYAPDPESTHDVSATGPTIILIAVLLLAVTVAIVLASQARTIGRPSTVGAIGLGLCGALIPMVALSLVLPAEAWQLRGSGRWASAAGVTLVAAWSWWLAAYAIGYQFRSRALAEVRAVFAGAAGLVAWYVIQQISTAPQLFLQRTLDVGTKMSPLLPLVAFGGVPAVLSAVELSRLKAFGVASKQSSSDSVCVQDWRKALESVAPLAPKGLRGLENALVNSYRTLLFLPVGWRALPIVSTLVAFAAVFDLDKHPALSVEGSLFGWSVVAVVLCLQWVLTTAVAQFLYLSCATAQLLTRLARHPRSLPWDLVPRELSQTGLVPRAPRLRDLAHLAGEVPGAWAMLQADLETRPAPRWFQSTAWKALQGKLTSIVGTGSATDASAVGARDDRFAAISVVFVVRELLSRLSFSLYLIGPSLALLVALYSTLYLDHSHDLLGLIWVDVLSAIVVIMSVFIWMERDAIISGIRHTTPGVIDWNWEFVWKVTVYVVLPLITLFAAQFPGIGSGLMKLLEPVQKLPGS